LNEEFIDLLTIKFIYKVMNETQHEANVFLRDTE